MIKTPEDMLPGTKHVTKNYGELEIVEYRRCKEVVVRFVTTGYECISPAQEIRSGYVKDVFSPRTCGVGYVGAGKFSSKNAKKIYRAWHCMISRCYNEKILLRKPTYMGCSVAPEWHNFQNFATWYEDNYPKDGGSYALDKDIKVSGNRVYSPETCMFVTQAENTIAAHAKSYVFLSPSNEVHEIYNLNSFCKENGLTQSAMSLLSLGKQKTHKGWKTI